MNLKHQKIILLQIFSQVSFLVIGALLACAEEDGKYKPDSTTTSATTIRPYTWTPRAWNDPAWREARPHTWNNNNWDSRWNSDPRWNSNVDPRWNVDPRINHTVGHNSWNRWNSPSWPNSRRYDGGVYGDYRTIRLDEKADLRGYHYVYETVGGVNAEEIGTFENVGLRHEGQKINGQVIITDREGVLYKINYQVESREAYIPRGSREAERVPPTIARLLALMETHK